VSEDILARIRDRCEWVAERAVHVRIDPRGLEALADELAETLVAGSAPGPALDPAHQIVVDAPTTLAYVLTIDAINFGSGWFPHVAKRPGLSGYLTVASALRDRFECKGPWSAGELSRLTARECAATLGQDLADPWVAELMDLYAQALRELGGFLGARYAGAFEGPVREASGSAASLVGILAGMPLYRDEASYTSPSSPAETWIVPFYKRAQITASDLAAAFGSSGPGAFRDLDELTLFADNLVPHVLRCAGVVVYAAQLARRGGDPRRGRARGRGAGGPCA